MGHLCKDYCPIANKENAVIAISPHADIETFPEGFAIPDPLTATPQSILLFLEYQEMMIEITMHEEAGNRDRGGNLTARRLMLTKVTDNATVKCGLDHHIANSMRWPQGGTGSIVIRGKDDCPFLPPEAYVFGGVTSRVKSKT